MKNNVWFVYDYYTASGRPKAEEALMKYARAKYLYHLIPEDMFDQVEMDLMGQIQKIREENKRLAPVSISANVPTSSSFAQDHMTIRIGGQSLRLRKVKGIIE